MTLLLLVFYAVAGAMLLAYAYARHVNGYWSRRGVPFVPAQVFIGNLRKLVLFKQSAGEHYAEMYAEAQAQKTPLLGMHVFMKPALLIVDRDLIKSVLVKDFGSFANRYSTSDLHTDLLGTANLFFVKSPAWRTIRSRLTPFFTSGKMRQMFGLMNDIGSELDTTLHKMRSVDRPGQGFVAEVRDLFSRYTTDVIASCAYGVQANSLQNPESEFRQQGRSIFDFKLWRAVEFTSIFFLPAIVPWFGFKTFSKKSTEFLRDSINYVMDERQKSGAVRNDLIDTLLVLKEEDRDKTLSPKNIVFQGDVLVAQAASFFTAGFETSSGALTFGLFELCRRPEMQQLIRDEIAATLKANNGQLTYEAVMGMQYVGQVVSEVLRMYPPLPFLDRECTAADGIKLGNVHVTRGTPVVVPVFAIQRDPEYFPHPGRFDPERFAPENRDQILPYTYMPFGTGPHNCIGDRFGMLQTRLGFVNFFRSHLVEASLRTPERLSFNPKALLMAPADGELFVNVVPAEKL